MCVVRGANDGPQENIADVNLQFLPLHPQQSCSYAVILGHWARPLPNGCGL
jgi:hypothetical protein